MDTLTQLTPTNVTLKMTTLNGRVDYLRDRPRLACQHDVPNFTSRTKLSVYKWITLDAPNEILFTQSLSDKLWTNPEVYEVRISQSYTLEFEGKISLPTSDQKLPLSNECQPEHNWTVIQVLEIQFQFSHLNWFPRLHEIDILGMQRI